MNVKLLAWTPMPELVVAAAGKGCYSSGTAADILEDITPEQAAKFIRQIKRSGHTSVLEHASFTFGVDGVSRSLLAQITRHRIASFSVQSQRYVNMAKPEFVMPEAVKNNLAAKLMFENCMEMIRATYSDIHATLMSEKLREKYAQYAIGDFNIEFRNNGQFFYLQLDAIMEQKKNEDEALYKQYKKDRSAAEKYANENARCVLPNAAGTSFSVTMNARELLSFFALRCCNRAQDEIRELAGQMLVLCQKVAPTIFENAGAPCVSGSCPEGVMTCGHPKTRQKGE